MRKIIVMALAVLLSFQSTAGAFGIKSITPDNSVIEDMGVDTEGDMEYLKSIADKYAQFFVVKQEEYVDISDIDRFYAELSKPLTVAEFDSGKTDMNLNIVSDKMLRNHLNQFKVLGGMAGYTAWFEPTVYYSIYRDITLVGGYSCYTKTYENTDDASWIYITSLEALTKEVLSYNTRIKLCEKMKELDNYVSTDKKFKIFLLKDGKIDSVWERDSV